MWAVLEVPEIDHLDTVTVYGLDPNETMYCKVVNAETLADITIITADNVVQINEVAVDDYRVVVFAYGKMTP